VLVACSLKLLPIQPIFVSIPAPWRTTMYQQKQSIISIDSSCI
jgi:hypothetical protein